jgi:hypothetical protein
MNPYLPRNAKARKTKRRKPEGLRQFLPYIPLYHTTKGKTDIAPHFIHRMKPMAYAKKLMLRDLTSFRLERARGRASEN